MVRKNPSLLDKGSLPAFGVGVTTCRDEWVKDLLIPLREV